MFVYEKRLQYPVHIKNTNPRLAKMIISQYGGPHGEIGASLRYLSQRYTMPLPELKAILTDIGTEGSLWAKDISKKSEEIVKSIVDFPNGTCYYTVEEISLGKLFRRMRGRGER
jgi:hypothetical protein